MQKKAVSDDPFKTVTTRLDNVTGSGDQREAMCPAHEDTSPSLSVSRGNSQPVVLHCHAGCTDEEILAALGLGDSWKDFLGDEAASKSNFESAPWDHGEEVAAYKYLDRDGAHVYTVKRYEHPEMPWKTFRPYEPGVEYGPGLDDDTDRELYRLPSVLEAAGEGRVVFLVEGEKDVHALEERGFTATTSGSSDSWKDRFSEDLAGAKVVILPDNDSAGRSFAEDAARSLYTETDWTRIVELEDLPHGGDVSDWLARGHDREELAEIVKDTSDVDASDVEAFVEEEDSEQDPQDDPQEDPGDVFTVEQFEADVEALDVDLPASSAQQKNELEYKVNGMAEQAAKLPPSKIEQAGAYLRTQGMRARSVRGWKSAVKKERQRQQEAQEEDQAQAAPQDLERGELTAWIAGKILDNNNAFALDGSGALYYWEGGRYQKGGEDYLDKRVKEVLDAENMTREFTAYRCGEVQHRIKTGAPTLWEHPPQDRINLQNGVLNLETGELEEHDPEEWLSTRQLPIEYDPEAEGSAWEEVLSDWMPEDGGAELGFEWIASQIRPAFGRRKATYLKGGKSKGKSTLLRNLVDGVFGPAAVEHMTLQELDDDPFAKADLSGAAVNICADLPATKLEGTSVFKRITGGDRMSAQRKYEDRFNFTPHCHLIFSGNVPIRAPQAGAPFWDRWLVIPFEGTEFDPSSDDYIPDDELDDRLQDPEELSALLNELLRVMERVREEGVTVTRTMKKALRDIRRTPGNDLDHETPGVPRQEPPHQGDSSPGVPEGDVEVKAKDTPESDGENTKDPKDEGSSGNNRTENDKTPPKNRGEGYAKNFKQNRDSDTHGTCPRSSAAKSFSEGDTVETPQGRGSVISRRDDDRLLVDLDHGPSERFRPSDLSDPDETPF